MTARILSKTAPWRYEIRFRWPDRTVYRERRFASVTSKSGALREAEGREAYLRERGKTAAEVATLPSPVLTAKAQAPSPAPTPMPTLREFGPRWIEGHCRALRQKRTGILTKEHMLRRHIYPALGDLPLDQITTEHVARLCAGLTRFSRKTLANILATLAKLLRTAVDWDVLREMPCKIKIPKSPRTPPVFYELAEMRRLIDAAASIDARTHALALIGLHGGLRRGEILGLEWGDISIERRQLVVRRNVISCYVDTPKSGHGRVLELSTELTAALDKYRRASATKTGRVFLQDSGQPALAQHLYKWMEAAMHKAGIPRRSGVRLHVMRHSACSALAALGAPMIAIQSLAGHESPQTTAKYMHLAPGVQAAAVRLFDGQSRGTGVASLDLEGEKGHISR
ncbi:MAG: tyrosine-type recombinase/integrase [Polyangiaceae bacterium]